MSAADEIRGLRREINALRREVFALREALDNMKPLDIPYVPYIPYVPSPYLPAPCPSYPSTPYITWEINYGPPLGDMLLGRTTSG